MYKLCTVNCFCKIQYFHFTYEMNLERPKHDYSPGIIAFKLFMYIICCLFRVNAMQIFMQINRSKYMLFIVVLSLQDL